MEVYKVTVAVDGRNLEAFVQAGVVATIETGTHQNKQHQTPKDKVSIVVGKSPQGPAAWVQVSQFNDARTINVTHEGWVTPSGSSLTAFSGKPAAVASVTHVASPPPEVVKCHQDATFGAYACCTAYGNGCYVTCCNGCCSDPYRCPGASCCG